MNIRKNPELSIAEIQVDEDKWRPIEEVVAEAGKENKSLRTYLRDTYGKIVEDTVR